jgi:citrate lyase subunit beta/citryl-CoA lyase
MTRRRSALCVPASEPAKVAKALALAVDEVIVDLEDAVAPDAKAAARNTVASLAPRDNGAIAVRVNAVGTPWHDEDLRVCASNEAVSSIVLPKAESVDQLLGVLAAIGAEHDAPARAGRLRMQTLIETAQGLAEVRSIARCTDRLDALIIGYADLSASLGRSITAPWNGIQDEVVLAARLGGIQAIDGPLLTVRADDALRDAADTARDLGFDGKWVIHPRQIATVQEAFTPTANEVNEARGILDALDEAIRDGRGAVQWRGRMLDEAVAIAARRVLSRGDTW